MTTKTSSRAASRALLLITSIELLVFLEVSIVNTALPTISLALGLGQAALAWVVNAYQLTFGGFQLVAGRAADLLGHRRMFQIGLAVFVGGSLLAAVAEIPAPLLLGRGLQGLGAAILIPAQLALIATIFTEPAAYQRAMGVWSAMAAFGAGAGVALGGVLTDSLGWPWVFWINVPIGVLALALSVRLLPRDQARGHHPRVARPRRSLDVTGAIALTTALVAVVYVTAELPVQGLTSVTLGVTGLGLVSAGIFVVTQRRSVTPLIPRSLLLNSSVRAGTIANFLVGAVHVPAFVLLTLLFQDVMDYSPTQAGLAVLPIAVLNLVVARTLVPWAMVRFGPRVVLASGMGSLAVGLLGYATLLGPGASYLWAALPASVPFAVGLPAVFVSATAPAVRAVASDQTGSAAGLVNTAQRIGASIGLTLLLLLSETLTRRTGEGIDALSTGLQGAMAGAGALALVGVVCALLLVARQPRDGDARPDSTGSEQDPTPTAREGNDR